MILHISASLVWVQHLLAYVTIQRYTEKEMTACWQANLAWKKERKKIILMIQIIFSFDCIHAVWMFGTCKAFGDSFARLQLTRKTIPNGDSQFNPKRKCFRPDFQTLGNRFKLAQFKWSAVQPVRCNIDLDSSNGSFAEQLLKRPQAERILSNR